MQPTTPHPTTMDQYLKQIPQPYQQYAVPAMGVVAALIVFLIVKAVFSSPPTPAKSTKKAGSNIKQQKETKKREEPKQTEAKKEVKKEEKEKKKDEKKKEDKEDTKKEETPKKKQQQQQQKQQKEQQKKEVKISSPKDQGSKGKKKADTQAMNDMLQEEDDMIRRYADLIDSKKKYPYLTILSPLYLLTLLCSSSILLISMLYLLTPSNLYLSSFMLDYVHLYHFILFLYYIYLFVYFFASFQIIFDFI